MRAQGRAHTLRVCAFGDSAREATDLSCTIGRLNASVFQVKMTHLVAGDMGWSDLAQNLKNQISWPEWNVRLDLSPELHRGERCGGKKVCTGLQRWRWRLDEILVEWFFLIEREVEPAASTSK